MKFRSIVEISEAIADNSEIVGFKAEMPSIRYEEIRALQLIEVYLRIPSTYTTAWSEIVMSSAGWTKF